MLNDACDEAIQQSEIRYKFEYLERFFAILKIIRKHS